MGTKDLTADSNDRVQKSSGNQGIKNANSVGALSEDDGTRSQVARLSIRWDKYDVSLPEVERANDPQKSLAFALAKGKEKVYKDENSMVGQ